MFAGALPCAWNVDTNANANGASLVAQIVKNLPAVQETQVQSLGRKDPLVKEMDGNSLQCSHLENSVDRILYQVLTSQLQF